MFDCQFPNLSGFATSTNGKLMEIHKSSLYIIGNEKAGYSFSSFCFYASGARQRFRFRLSACYFAGRLCRPDDCSRWSGLLHDPFGVQLCPGIPRLAFARPSVLGACLPCARLGLCPRPHKVRWQVLYLLPCPWHQLCDLGHRHTGPLEQAH